MRYTYTHACIFTMPGFLTQMGSHSREWWFIVAHASMERRVVFTAIKTRPMIRTVSIVVNLLLVRFVFFAEGIFIDLAKRFTIGPDPKRGPALFSIVARLRRQKGSLLLERNKQIFCSPQILPKTFQLQCRLSNVSKNYFPKQSTKNLQNLPPSPPKESSEHWTQLPNSRELLTLR
ncbi:uncharacterized protein LOC121243909 isoform X2 [Juglans microcarpa x Juglans regia]|uniref:uncharacterized protein LOC121243909 isoform X2 n=1 Tax=Juglans microcarpa x Juglans regia TaxID=2249226 RepID=UPI001B7DCA3D|nr:uncharacterized protein LOC121243909 isoform X2 [Juglans microcarpa x Juglans regia]